MGFNFSFFGDNSHRQFNYKPRYYDVEAEERRKFFGEHPEVDELPEREDNPEVADGKAPHKPGRYISGSFRDGNYQRVSPGTSKTQKIIGMITLILVFVVLTYIAKFYGLILK